jgi:excisionase family DNA binding protein
VPDSAWATPAEIAREFRLNRATVYRLIESGKIRATRIGGSWRINRSDVARSTAPEPIGFYNYVRQNQEH